MQPNTTSVPMDIANAPKETGIIILFKSLEDYHGQIHASFQLSKPSQKGRGFAGQPIYHNWCHL